MLDLWSQKRFTAVLVTHDVDEAVFLSDRIAVLSHRPGVIVEIVETGMPRPRNPVDAHSDPRFISVRHQLLSYLLKKPEAAHA
jgi:NitT/TauT family transport system ATP-binding protein